MICLASIPSQCQNANFLKSRYLLAKCQHPSNSSKYVILGRTRNVVDHPVTPKHARLSLPIHDIAQRLWHAGLCTAVQERAPVNARNDKMLASVTNSPVGPVTAPSWDADCLRVRFSGSRTGRIYYSIRITPIPFLDSHRPCLRWLPELVIKPSNHVSALLQTGSHSPQHIYNCITNFRVDRKS